MRRAWQLFDWVRALPEGHGLRRLCDAHTYTTMITLCGPWQQLRRALQLVAEMRARSLECGTQVLPAPISSLRRLLEPAAFCFKKSGSPLHSVVTKHCRLWSASSGARQRGKAGRCCRC